VTESLFVPVQAPFAWKVDVAVSTRLKSSVKLDKAHRAMGGHCVEEGDKRGRKGWLV